VERIVVKYFDTVPRATSLSVLRTGYLFVGAEFGAHCLYQFLRITDEAAEEEIGVEVDIEGDRVIIPHFKPRGLTNLLLVDTMESLSPVIEMKVMDLVGEDAPQIYALCGRGPNSSLRVLRHGLAVSEVAVSELPGNPNAVWTVRSNAKEESDRYIVVSFVNATLVLSIGETVEEVTDSGFLATAPTLKCCLIGDDSLLQVHNGGIRHIRADRRIHEWKPPGKKHIVHAAVNNRQVVIALGGGEVIYFELDVSGQLVEVEKKEMPNEVACVDVGPIPEGRQRCRFMAVGTFEGTWIVRILSLDPDDRMTALSRQALPAQPVSLALSLARTKAGDGVSSHALFLHVGLANGVSLRIGVDATTGALSPDYRTRLLGGKAVQLVKLNVRGESGVMALSTRSWLCYNMHGRYNTTPLSYDTLEYAASFSSEQCPDGIVAVAGNTLRIITLELGESFNQTLIPLKYTPRRLIIHPSTGLLALIESDHNDTTRAQCAPMAGPGETPEGPDPLLSVQRAGTGVWASCIRLLEPTQLATLDLLELEDNEAAVSVATVTFAERGGEVFLLIGTGKDMKLQPRSSNGGFIHTYRVAEGRLQLIHKTPTDGIPQAMAAYQGRLLVGLGPVLRIYDLGKKKLLRKCENKTFPCCITSIFVYGPRIYVGDVSESFHMVRYKKSDNMLYIFADDTAPRWLTSQTLLDYDTLAGGDKFGNVFVARLPQDVSDDVEDDPTGAKIKWDAQCMNGAANKMEEVIQFHVGEAVTGLQRSALQAGGTEGIIYATLAGGIGALVPFTSREDVDFFTHLEMHLRQENPPLCGRDHLSFRSYYYPCKDVIDGDLCEQFAGMNSQRQRAIAEELDRTPGEIMKKLEDMRNRLL